MYNRIHKKLKEYWETFWSIYIYDKFLRVIHNKCYISANKMGMNLFSMFLYYHVIFILFHCWFQILLVFRHIDLQISNSVFWNGNLFSFLSKMIAFDRIGRTKRDRSAYDRIIFWSRNLFHFFIVFVLHLIEIYLFCQRFFLFLIVYGSSWHRIPCFMRPGSDGLGWYNILLSNRASNLFYISKDK